MRLILGIVLAIAAALGALYGVGRFLLPNTLEVSQSVTIARPRAAVFAMANDLRIAREWSPYYARDPEAEYTFSGQGPGAGQSMRWTSRARDIGEGRMTIITSAMLRSVDAIVQVGDEATLNSRFSIVPVDRGVSASWRITSSCAEDWRNIPCRYMNLVLQRSIAADIAAGLARLKTLAEQLPNVDFEGLNGEIVSVEPQPYLYLPVTTSARDEREMDRALLQAVQQVRAAMAQNAIIPAGAVVRATTEYNLQQQRLSFNVGYPFSGPAPLTLVGVQVGQTPSGRALRVLHNGPRTGMRQAYLRAYAYLQAHRIALREDGNPWEVVLSDELNADPGALSVAIYIPLQ